MHKNIFVRDIEIIKNEMSRTKRIYNSYEKFGRFFGKESSYNWEKDQTGKFHRIQPQPIQIKSEKDPRYTEYGVWCMGNCRMCRKHNPKHETHRRKTNKKVNILKFEALF